MRTRTFAAWLLGLAMIAAAPLAAHHSFDAEYDVNKPVTLTGVVTKVDWVNPHAYISINYENEAGVMQTFTCELGPPYALTRGGWKRNTVQIGDTIKIDNAAMAKDGTNRGGATRETFLFLADGTRMVMR